MLGIGLSAFLVLFALWCTFADDVWHIERNSVERRIGVGSWHFTRRYRDAELQIISRPYYGRASFYARRTYRLYAVSSETRRFLLEPRLMFERGEEEAKMLAAFISAHTG